MMIDVTVALKIGYFSIFINFGGFFYSDLRNFKNEINFFSRPFLKFDGP